MSLGCQAERNASSSCTALQVFSKNMSQKGEPAITPCTPDDNWTSISFTPDLKRFGAQHA